MSSQGLNLEDFAFPGLAGGRSWRLSLRPLPRHFERRVKPKLQNCRKKVEESVCLPVSWFCMGPLLVFLVVFSQSWTTFSLVVTFVGR